MKGELIRAIAPLQSWDIFAQYLGDEALIQRKKDDMKTLDKLKSKYDWDINAAFLLDEDYTTLVITNYQQKITWVNAGFPEMTGYTRKDAIGKHPRFLQGKETSKTTRSEINKSISSHTAVHKQLLNYRKDGTAYLCDIKIIPIYSKDSEVTHFMALERKTRKAA